MQATLADLTCDSDGKITRFIGPDSTPSSVLPVHELRQGEAYYLGMFLGGVYQVSHPSTHRTRSHALDVLRSEPRRSLFTGVWSRESKAPAWTFVRCSLPRAALTRLGNCCRR